MPETLAGSNGPPPPTDDHDLLNRFAIEQVRPIEHVVIVSRCSYLDRSLPVGPEIGGDMFRQPL